MDSGIRTSLYRIEILSGSVTLVELIIGTANLGRKYGLKENQLTTTDFRHIVLSDVAISEFGIDTSPDYGSAEAICNEIVDKPVNFYSKIHYNGIDKILTKSALKMNFQKTLLIHNWQELNQAHKIQALRLLAKEVEHHKIDGFGFSTYEDLCDFEILSLYPNMCIQVPLNVLNQTLLSQMYEIKKKLPSIKFFTRSVFLQGLLTSGNLVYPLQNHPDIVKFREFCGLLQITPLRGALEFIRNQSCIDGLVIGVNSFQEWIEIASVMRKPRLTQMNETIWSELRSHDSRLYDPRNWTP